ncbi:AraC family transcriptional regulator [Paenibacillus sp. sptzw28]|uniref:AraC family transcriptional regulator n=1 Tax=Paenibacillus sp. sptzw28 TaxID=715179 RepID=UPI002868A027|nr:AraC family transcriptional regulator [Paenibacillus sp. sptzw28]
MASIIPLLALGFFSYMKSSKSIQHHVNESNVHLMDQMNGNMEQVLRTVDYTLNYVINSNLVQEALYHPLTYYDFQLYNNLKLELSLLQSPDTKVTDVILANTASNWLINNRGLYKFSENEAKNTLLQLAQLPNSTSWVLLGTDDLGSSETQSYGCKYTIALVKKMPLHTTSKRGLALATIPSCKLAAMMDKETASRKVMVLDKDYRVIVHPDQNKIGKSLADANYVKPSDLRRFNAPSGQFETESGEQPVTVTYVRSGFNGWIYVSFTEIAAITKESKSIGWFTLYVSLLIIALSVLFVWLGSRRVYSPIRKIFQGITERLPEAGRSKNELQIIDEHIRDLFASNANLRHELHQNSQQVRAFFLHKWYQGNINPVETNEKLAFFGYSGHIAGWEHLAVITLQIDILEETRYEPEDADLLLFAINNMIEEMIPPSDRLPPVIIDQTQVTMVGCGSRTLEAFNDYVYKLTEDIQQNMRSYLDLDVSIGISLPFKDVHKAPRAYKEGLEALKQRLKLGKGVIVPYFSLNSGKHTRVYFYPKQVQNELFDAIKLADEARADELLKQWLEEVFQKERSPQEYQTSLIRLLNDLMIVSQEASIAPDQLNIHESSLYEELMHLYVSSEIGHWFKSRLIHPMIQVFRDRQESQYHNLSGKIIEIIQKEYNTDLTLEECALRLHYNVFYLSSIFKKETDMSFSEYLSQYRFEMAKKWLVDTDMPVKEIAESLAYTNPQNFIRFFRKQENMTPGQYRKMYGSK